MEPVIAQPRKGTGEQLSEMLRCRLRFTVVTVKHRHLEYYRDEIASDFRRGSELVTDLALGGSREAVRE